MLKCSGHFTCTLIFFCKEFRHFQENAGNFLYWEPSYSINVTFVVFTPIDSLIFFLGISVNWKLTVRRHTKQTVATSEDFIHIYELRITCDTSSMSFSGF